MLSNVHRFIVALACLAAVTAAHADANRLPNGNFDFAHLALPGDGGGGGSEYESGWWWITSGALGAGSIAWQALDDAAGAADSGALEFATDVGGHATWTNSQCFDVPAGGTVSVGGKYRIISIGGADPDAAAFAYTCTVYSGYCSGTALAELAPVVGRSGAWAPMATAEGTLPAGARTAICEMSLDNDSNGQAAAIEVDDLFFTTDVLFQGRFEF